MICSSVLHDPGVPPAVTASKSSGIVVPQPVDQIAGAVEVDDLPAHYFEQYKLAVEMADQLSARRGTANTFFLTVNTGLAALLGGQDLRWYVAAAGIVFAGAWWALLKSYRDLSNAKWDVITDMEKLLPVRVFGDEWQRLKPSGKREDARRQRVRTRLGKYRELGQVERVVPWIFVAIYSAELFRQLT
jgi:hypothetical protein